MAFQYNSPGSITPLWDSGNVSYRDVRFGDRSYYR